MPLRDHFRPPLADRRSWEGFHGGWPMMIVNVLSRTLPPRYIAEPQVHLGSSIEIDVATYEEDETDQPVEAGGGVATAVWAPPRPTLAIETDLGDLDEYGVRVYDTRRGRRLVAAVEIVSPANKDRPEHRRAFVSKCVALLQDRVSLAIVDVVTTRNANLFVDLMEWIGNGTSAVGADSPSLYAVACHFPRGQARLFETWSHPLGGWPGIAHLAIVGRPQLGGPAGTRGELRRNLPDPPNFVRSGETMKKLSQECPSMRRLIARIAVVVLLASLGGATVLGQSVEVPPLSKIRRVERGNFPTQQEQATSTFITRTTPHPALGDRYLILTDLTDKQSLEALERLAKFRGGEILSFDDLGRLAKSAEARKELETKLKAAKPKFVAIALRPASYREEVVLALWDVLASLDGDPELDVFPGFLVASDSKGLAGLVDRSIAYKTVAHEAVRPFMVGQVADNSTPQGTRSLQKVGILRNYFQDQKIESSSLVVRMYRARKSSTVGTPESRQWDVSARTPGTDVEEIPSGASKALEGANLVAMFGHGAPGKTCSLDVDAFRSLDLSNQVILCGSCFSAAPLKSEFGPMDRDLDGSALKFDRTRFLDRALDRGAVVFFGHMRLNSGFPHLFPVLEGWMDGLTVGEGYQRLIDALLINNNFQPDEIPIPPGLNRDAKAVARRNVLLYMVVGDPALRPMAATSAAH